MNFYDILLAKKLSGGGGGDITTEALNVTANGQYTAPQGKAYTPVNVNVAGYKVGEVETPTPIATFNGTSNPLKSLTASIVPVQDLHGYDSPWVGGAGKNKLPYFTAEEKNGIRLAYNNGVVILNGTASANTFFTLTDLNFARGTYTFSANNTEINNNVHVSLREIGATSDFTDLPMNNLDKYNTYQNVSIGQVTLYALSGTQLTNFRLSLQIEISNQATSFAPYSNICPISGWTNETITVTDDLQNPTVTHTTTIPFTDGQGQSVEVFGGSVDVVNGGGSDYKEYDSYNGETLIGPWISDRDVYVPNTSPTIGAQVVDMGDTTTFYTQPTSIKSLDGDNNVFASTGQIEDLEYFEKL